MTANARPILSLLPSTVPEVKTHLAGEPAEFTVVKNPYVTLHLGKSSMGIKVKGATGESQWISICFIRNHSDNMIGVLSHDSKFIYTEGAKNAESA